MYNIRTFCLLICGLERFFNRALLSRGLPLGLCLLPSLFVCLFVLLCQCWFPLNYWNIIVSQIHTNNECFVYKAFIIYMLHFEGAFITYVSISSMIGYLAMVAFQWPLVRICSKLEFDFGHSNNFYHQSNFKELKFVLRQILSQI